MLVLLTGHPNRQGTVMWVSLVHWTVTDPHRVAVRVNCLVLRGDHGPGVPFL